jgi:biotin carboxyl carrier protein
VDNASKAPIAGKKVKAGEVIGHVQTYYGIEDIVAAVDGIVVAALAKQGDKVEKAEIVAFIQ